MNPVYIRLIVYALSSLLTMLPLSLSSWVSYDAASQMLSVSIPGLAAAIVGGLAMSGAVFARWGKK